MLKALLLIRTIHAVAARPNGYAPMPVRCCGAGAKRPAPFGVDASDISYVVLRNAMELIFDPKEGRLTGLEDQRLSARPPRPFVSTTRRPAIPFAFCQARVSQCEGIQLMPAAARQWVLNMSSHTLRHAIL